MPHTRSSEKRVRQNETRRLRNRSQKGVLKAQIKKVIAAVDAKDKTEAQKELKVATKLLDRASTKSILHKNLAAHKKSALAVKVNSLGA